MGFLSYQLWCHENFLNSRSLMYAREIRHQLSETVQRLNLQMNSCGKNFNKVRKCLLMGLFDNIAELEQDNFYVTISGGQRAKVHPSSVFHGKRQPRYIIFSETTVTKCNFMSHVTEISPEWLPEVVPNFSHLSRIKTLS